MRRLYIVLFCLYFGKAKTNFSGICFDNTLKTPLPVRYLFIQLVDKNGRNLTEEAFETFEIDKDEQLLKVDIIKDNDSNCRYRHELINNFDGTFIFRLRILVACKSLKINVFSPKAPETSLCDGPFLIDDPGLLNPEECNCNGVNAELPTPTQWINAYCPKDQASYAQLFRDFGNYDAVDFEKTLQKVENKWGHPDQAKSAAVCRYKLSKGQLNKHCYGEYTGFSMFSDDILTSLARKMQFPEMEFIWNLGDWPLEPESPKGNGSGVPIISWCGSNTTFDIVLPTYEVTEASLKSMDTIARDMQNVKGHQFVAWTEKINKAVFRGRDSNELRLRVAKLAIDRPDIIEGGITSYFFFDERENPKPVEHQPFSDFFKYRYILNIDGTVAAYRFGYLLAANSIVLKQDSTFYEHFYTLIQPNVHYIPFNESNLIETIERLQTSDYLRHISKAARAFVKQHLQPLNIYCYYAMFLQEYAKLYKPPVSKKHVDYSMEAINISPLTEIQKKTFCNCKVSEKLDEL